MNSEKKELMDVVENLNGKATIRDWATAAHKLSPILDTGTTRFYAEELSYKSRALIEMWKNGLSEATPYTCIENILHSDWMLRYSMRKNENKAVFTFDLNDFS